MAYAEKRESVKRGTYWRGRYKIDRDRVGIVVDANGETIRFDKKRDAEKAANDAEAAIRNGAARQAPVQDTLFGEYASRWYAAQDLAASTMQNYKRHIEEHLLPAFGDKPIGEILPSDVATWEKNERAVPYAASSVKTWRGTLHLILSDAVEEGIREVNPATKRRGRGKRAGRSRNRGPEKAVTTALGVLLIAERAALLSGRDDEFVAVVLKGFTGMRWGEIVGLETEFVRAKSVRVEWQLYELDTGELHRCPPKDDSHRTIDVPGWLSGLLVRHITHAQRVPCQCHGLKYVFRGHRAANGTARQVGAKLVDVARRAEVSTGTASAVLNRPEGVPERTRVKVQAAMAELGYMRGGWSGELAPHWRRTGFATWLFQPAATGWYPRKTPSPARPVPIVGTPWPGVPVRGRNAAGRADACWLPIAKGLTPHGLRHTHKTLMEELGVPPKLMDERMGHEDGSVQARYSHVTQVMRDRLMDDLTSVWKAAVEARRKLSPGSPVGALDRILRAAD